MATHESTGLDQYQKDFIKLIRDNARRHHLYEVFRDFCEMTALTFSNVCDLRQREQREARYLQIIGRYTEDEVKRFPAMVGCVVNSLERRFHDCLGQIFMSLELGDHWKGQFFTPYPVAYLMAQLGGVASSGEEIERKGFITLQEPACGAGCMVIAAAEAMRDNGIDYQRRLHVTAIDVDQTAAHMAYIQLTLLHIPAIVIRGNALWPDNSRSTWVTFAHVIGGWDRKLARAEATQEAGALLADPAPADQAEDEQEAVALPAGANLAKVRAEVVAAHVAEQIDLF